MPRRLITVALAALAGGAAAHAAHTRNIVLTGYWPPTNEMLRQFSTNPAQNPGGWLGKNWEGRGYDVYAFFPEFPQGLGRGEGDFEVDYQDTVADWNLIIPMFNPVAMVQYTRGNTQLSWEIESRNQNRSSWTNDYLAPLQPTPSPPDGTVPAGFIRNSSLPMQRIMQEVNAAGLGINAFIDTSANMGGSFLSEFIGYHGNWWHDTHSLPTDPAYNVAAGHIHVGINTPVANAKAASEITLRVLISHVQRTICPADLDQNDIVAAPDLAILLGAWGTSDPNIDLSGDGIVNSEDLALQLGSWGACP